MSWVIPVLSLFVPAVAPSHPSGDGANPFGTSPNRRSKGVVGDAASHITYRRHHRHHRKVGSIKIGIVGAGSIGGNLTGVSPLWQQIGHPVIKVFNGTYAQDILDNGHPKGSPGRQALPVAGDDAAAKQVVRKLIDGLGFDTVDAGGVDESWRQQPGTAVYGHRGDAEAVAEALSDAFPRSARPSGAPDGPGYGDRRFTPSRWASPAAPGLHGWRSERVPVGSACWRRWRRSPPPPPHRSSRPRTTPRPVSLRDVRTGRKAVHERADGEDGATGSGRAVAGR